MTAELKMRKQRAGEPGFGKERMNMEEQFEQELRENEAGVDAAIKRFMGNKALYRKFLLKFLNDHSYEAIVEHVHGGNYEEAFNSAHTLMGVSANLGLDPICKGASEITELLRGKQPDEVDRAKVDAALEELGRVSDIFRGIIAKYE